MQLLVNERQQELKSHGNFAFPVLVSNENLSQYERSSFLWHWHPEIELTYIKEGEIYYQVNDKVYELHAGDILFCNSNALHTGHKIRENNCFYISITFHPRMVYGYEGSTLHHKYVSPILTDNTLSSIAFYPSVTCHPAIFACMEKIYHLYDAKPETYELQIQQQLSALWLIIYHYLQKENHDFSGSAGKSRDMERIRAILSYLHENYGNKLTLEDISSQVNLCKSECCRFFKKYMKQSIFDYLNHYRIEKSLSLLSENQLSITEIAEQTGFSNSSYFSKTFKEQMHCSPTEYYRNHIK